MFKIFVNWEKFANTAIYFYIYFLNLWMIWEELCPTLSLNVESKMANLYKISEGGHILNLINNELDIPSPQI